MDSDEKNPTDPGANPPPPTGKAVASDSDVGPGIAAKARAAYDKLFPPDSPQRKWGPLLVAAPVLILLLLTKCAVSTATEKVSALAEAREKAEHVRTTGVLLVKSNLPEATVEAVRLPPAVEPASAPRQGPLGQSLSGLAPGRYAVTVRAAGWPDARGEVEVAAGQTAEATVDFTGGSLRLESTPPGAIVKRDGQNLGKTPLVIPLLPPGDVLLTLQYPGWPATDFTAAITEKAETTASVRMPHGRLTVDSFPAGAVVVLDGKSYQKTPLFFDPISAGPKKLTLQAPDLPPLEVTATVVDGQETRIRPVLATAFPMLDPAALLRDVWVVDDKRDGAPAFNSLTNLNRPRNDIVRNLHRQVLYNNWRRKTYRFSGTVKAYDPTRTELEFVEQKTELAPYRVTARLKAAPAAPERLQRGATLTVYGRLSDVLESAWPLRLITFELADADVLPADTP